MTDNLPTTSQNAAKGELITSKINPELPDFLRDQEVIGVEDLGQHVKPPRLKVMQTNTRAPLSEIAAKGDIVVVPQNLVLFSADRNPSGQSTGLGAHFYMTPIFHWSEFISWNPQGSDQPIRDRSIDPKSSLARICRDPQHWQVPHPDFPNDPKKTIRNCEHLNFLVMIEDAPEGLDETPIIISFVRSEFKHGQNFASLIKLRRASICAGRYLGQVGFRKNAEGEWYGLDIKNPPGNNPTEKFVSSRERYEALVELHKQYKQLHTENLIDVDYDEDVNGSVVGGEDPSDAGEF